MYKREPLLYCWLLDWTGGAVRGHIVLGAEGRQSNSTTKRIAQHLRLLLF